MRQISFRAMGCTMLAALDAEAHDVAAQAALDAVPHWFAAWEQCLSRFRPTSELSRLNHRAGTGWVALSPVLTAVLDAALRAADASDGLVVPTVLADLERAGYDRDFARVASANRRRPAGTRHHADWRAIRFDAARGRVALPVGMQLDLGGSAKGWAADLAARRLAEHGPALVDAGGDIALIGPRRDGSAWPIAVADPHHPEQTLEVLLLDRGAVATSGIDVRRWLQDGQRRHHIIDPRSGSPADTDLLTATVVTGDARTAEMAAKLALILGRAAAHDWLGRQPAIAALLVHQDGTHTATPSFDAYCWRHAARRA
ncbi:MAG: FAD:protein FMN transferase [Chloroflexi bacterium]|nr:FAD:protein FMN transferase [Chloroflexota bacterium]